ncbi:DNA-binding transcriptional regulator YbjK [Nocardioides luteus]|uniref:TetR family transcriptional regulator n=1 Tax=Nocardioides luteus TaxID=1844 RepID=A0ABQ5SUS7_9ACTN|nr:TetR family transcriptional regulator [Nocardioides luteus]MDR7309863.1 DNA-binding transcriptional regulator YbjK [Nocardioides luteus]GGR59974.1 TetR family transcriptional regulator [Nocardioides luteus]GLJ67229.1 TetR family transcriptional regulator [Nocardioides luteus]
MKRRHGDSARQRRDALVRATIEVAAEKGMSGVTHRAVTERAGLPLTTVGYFFDSISDLAAEALRTGVAEDVARLRTLADELAAAGSGAEATAEAFASALTSPPGDSLAFVEALVHAARDEEFRPVVGEVLTAGRAVAEQAAEVVGATPADPASLLALVHGYLLHALAAPDLVEPDALLRGLRALAIGTLVDRGEISLALRVAGREAEISR